jgi:RES domain-containing protein
MPPGLLRAVRVCARTYDPKKASGRANRWNAADQLVLYLSEHFGTAVLESVVHAGKAPPLPAHAAWVTIPDDAIEALDVGALPGGWDDPDELTIARAVGARWYQEERSAALIIPSVPGQPFERNVVINTTHEQAAKIKWEPIVEIPWDPRLFG